jgi:bifunctional oligoribonuclease and PAP phosphatase NrnA
MIGDLDRAAEVIATAQRVMVSCHRGPDGDSVGSMVALAAILRARGQRVTLYSTDLIPRSLKWLPFAKRGVAHRLGEGARFDVTVVVDCGDPKLLGSAWPGREITGTVVALDHHARGVAFGDVYVCDPQAASTGVLIARMARERGWRIPPEAAVGLYVSIASDTGSFRYSNTNAESLRLASYLVEEGGVNPGQVSERLYEQHRPSRYRLLAAALATLETALDGRVAFMVVTHDTLAKARASWEDTDGLPNYARAIQGVECGVLLTPAKGGGVRVSLRSKGHLIDAAAVCAELGGGGHRGAAGCTLPGELADARERVEGALAEALAAATRSRPTDRLDSRG